MSNVVFGDPSSFPPEYPIDQQLLIEAETLGSGADIHDRNKYRLGYSRAAERYKANPNQTNWLYCNDVERLLRGVVAEAKCGRNRGNRIL